MKESEFGFVIGDFLEIVPLKGTKENPDKASIGLEFNLSNISLKDKFLSVWDMLKTKKTYYAIDTSDAVDLIRALEKLHPGIIQEALNLIDLMKT